MPCAWMKAFQGTLLEFADLRSFVAASPNVERIDTGMPEEILQAQLDSTILPTQIT